MNGIGWISLILGIVFILIGVIGFFNPVEKKLINDFNELGDDEQTSPINNLLNIDTTFCLVGSFFVIIGNKGKYEIIKKGEA